MTLPAALERGLVGRPSGAVPATDLGTALAVRQVRVMKGGRSVLCVNALDFASGTCTAVLGPNGAGKTTLLRVLAGEEAVSGGSVTVRGEPAGRGVTESLARRRAWLAQRSLLEGDYPVAEVVGWGRLPWRRLETRAAAASVVRRSLEAAGILALADRAYSGLSGGERQLVHLARSWAQLDGSGAGAVWLLDEPAAALDLQRAGIVGRMLAEARRRGWAVVVVLHDPNQAAAWADRVVLVAEGRVRAAGLTADVLKPATLSAIFGVPCEAVERPGGARWLLFPDSR